MKVLVTGAGGFIGKNLIYTLGAKDGIEVLSFDLDSDPGLLIEYTRDCDMVFHLAGVNRPQDEKDFMEGNFSFTAKLLEGLKTGKNYCPIVVTSSVQAALDNPYGRSKKAGEDLLTNFYDDTGAPVLIYRLPNVFGKWSRPNYNSAVATFCHNIARGLPITINDPLTILNLTYIDDVVKEFVVVLNMVKEGKTKALENLANQEGFCSIPVVHSMKLGEITDLLYSFKDSRDSLSVPDVSDEFTRKLYATYLSFLPEGKFSYPLKEHADERGSFTEILRTADRGQFSVNISKPGITKGNHWHHTKNEKFVVVSGVGVIRFRKVGEDKVIEYHVSEDKQEIVDIPTGYTHNIENLGNKDLITFMWASECFNPDNPDTFFLEV